MFIILTQKKNVYYKHAIKNRNASNTHSFDWLKLT